MDPAFICEFTPTVPMIAARIRKYSQARCVFLLLIGIGLSVYVLVNAVFNMIYYGFDPTWLRLLVFSLALLLFGIFFPWISAFFSVRNFKNDVTAKGTYKIAFGDNIEITQGTIRVIWEYSDISKIYRLKHSYDLVKTERLSLIVDPNGFTQGTFEDFKKFLKEKRPDLTVPE